MMHVQRLAVEFFARLEKLDEMIVATVAAGRCRHCDGPLHHSGTTIASPGIVGTAVSRKNWLFIGNDDADEVNATFVSLIARCQLHGLEPWAYLRDLFCLLPSWPQRRVLDLFPPSGRRPSDEEYT
jgi:hypothetical protein